MPPVAPEAFENRKPEIGVPRGSKPIGVKLSG